MRHGAHETACLKGRQLRAGSSEAATSTTAKKTVTQAGPLTAARSGVGESKKTQ